MHLILNDDSGNTTGTVTDKDYTELLTSIQKSLDTINEKLDKKDEQGSANVGDEQMDVLISEIKEIRKIQYEDHHIMFYSYCLAFGIFVCFILYRIIKMFTC